MLTDYSDVIDVIDEQLKNLGYKAEDLEDEDGEWDFEKISNILMYEVKLVKAK